MIIQCANIKCDGCVNKIKEALGSKFPNLKIDKTTQTLEIEANKEDEQIIKTKLKELGFLANESMVNKIKGFFAK